MPCIPFDKNMTAAELSLINELYQLSRSVSPEDSATFNSKCQAAVPTLLNVIKTQADDVELLRTCICILKEHCYDSDTNSAYLPTTDALPLVLSAVQRHASNVGLVLQVLGLFVNLTVLDANRTIIGNAGANPNLCCARNQCSLNATVDPHFCP